MTALTSAPMAILDPEAEPARVPAGEIGAIMVRDATVDDIAGVQTIYATHVLTSTGTFEEVPPDVAEIARRHQTVMALGLPWLVAEIHGRLAGYAYAGTFRPRSAYRFTVEDSVYVAPGLGGKGIGRVLLAELIARCAGRGMRQMIAMIGDSANAGSIGLHARMGFQPVGVLTAVGFKHGRWVDMVMMRRALGPGDTEPPLPLLP